MAEEVIKTTSCCNDAMMGGLLGAMANRDSNPLAMAAMMRNRDDDDMWNNPFAYMMMMGVMLPFFMFGIYEKNGQPLETVLRQMVETKWLRPRRRPYETDNTYAALEREMRLRKEVKALEEQAKKARR